MTTTMSTVMPTDEAAVQHAGISALYTVSYLWYSTIGAVTVVVVGLIVSAMTGMNRLGDVDPRFLVPVLYSRCPTRPVRATVRRNQESREQEELVQITRGSEHQDI